MFNDETTIFKRLRVVAGVLIACLGVLLVGFGLDSDFWIVGAVLFIVGIIIGGTRWLYDWLIGGWF